MICNLLGSGIVQLSMAIKFMSLEEMERSKSYFESLGQSLMDAGFTPCQFREEFCYQDPFKDFNVFILKIHGDMEQG